MKLLKHILLITLLIGSFIGIDYALADESQSEIGIVAYKTFLPPGNYHPIKSPPDIYALVIIQPGERTGYYFRVPPGYYDDVNVEDRVPLTKKYGLITGYEYHQEIEMFNNN